MTKHPQITVQLSGTSGNAGLIIGKVSRALRRAGIPDQDIDQFQTEATSSDYDAVITTAMEWVNVE